MQNILFITLLYFYTTKLHHELEVETNLKAQNLYNSSEVLPQLKTVYSTMITRIKKIFVPAVIHTFFSTETTKRV